MTLLEVILSFVIFGGTVAIVGEMARTAFQNAKMARDLIQAELLAESILAKLRLGIIEMETVIDAPVISGTYGNRTDIIEDTHAVAQGDTSVVLWNYSIEILDVPELSDYLVKVSVEVRQNVPEGRRAVTCRLVRWLALEPVVEEELY
jgi:hypothetical protein